jgi:hypothetical protein
MGPVLVEGGETSAVRVVGCLTVWDRRSFKKAVEGSHQAAMAETTHSLKSVCGHVGANPLAGMSQVLGLRGREGAMVTG